MPKTQDPGNEGYAPSRTSHPYVFPAFWLIVFVGALTASGPWAERHFIFFGATGLLMIAFPPVVAIPRLWWILAGLFLLFGTACFLPVSWFGMPEWRSNLESLGVKTGSRVVVQSRMALETWGYFAAMVVGCLWIAGHRVPANQLRPMALVFGIGVAIYAVLAALMPTVNGYGTYGFFANRNHTATYLAMGALCSAGIALQYIRDKSYTKFSIALLVVGICFWALFFQSISRAGILLVGIGAVIWIALIGTRYFGDNSKRIVLLGGILLAGVFLIVDSTVKQRLTDSIDKVKEESVSNGSAADQPADYRLLVAKDAADMIKQFPLTGIGGGQFLYLSSYYRKHTLRTVESYFAHPESDWLWITAELGIPAALALLAAVAAVTRRAVGSVRQGKGRAVRAGFCTAGLLLLIHSFFDVPGHHVPLTFGAALLITLSLPAHSGIPTGSIAVWISKSLGAALILLAITILWLGGGDRTALDTVFTKKISRKATALVQEDLARGHLPQEGEVDGIQQAIDLLGEGASRLPLDPQFYHRRAVYLSAYTDTEPAMKRDFTIERALAPLTVSTLLKQAVIWKSVDAVPETMDSWKEALSRAQFIDTHAPNPKRTLKSRIFDRIRNEASSHPELKRQVEESLSPR